MFGLEAFNLKLKFQNRFKPKWCHLLQIDAPAQYPVQWWQQGNESTTAAPDLCQTAKQWMATAIEECTDSAAANSKAHMKSQPQIKLISFHHQKTPKEGRVQRAMLKQESVIYIFQTQHWWIWPFIYKLPIYVFNRYFRANDL